MNADLSKLWLKLKIDHQDLRLDESGEMDDFVTGIHGEILGTWFDENENESEAIQVGRFNLYQIHVRWAQESGICLSAILDLDAATEAFDWLFDDGEPTVELRDAVGGEVFPSKILILDGITINQEYRGRNLGQVVMDKLIRHFGGGCDDLVLLQACPLQFVGDNHREKAKQMGLPAVSRKKAAQKLRQLYGELGFAQVGGTDFMGLSLANRWRGPFRLKC